MGALVDKKPNDAFLHLKIENVSRIHNLAPNG